MYHSGAPVFHDAYKSWSCCEKKTTDFTEFLNIKVMEYRYKRINTIPLLFILMVLFLATNLCIPSFDNSLLKIVIAIYLNFIVKLLGLFYSACIGL